ncbi:hypothetical protein BDD26_0873 [Xenorhabdus cabanillasii]|uniref:Uncharacterized protein n=1 Tax=Xenorhabdus cabanillasii TaxID=351673 RepID=A0A3D9UJU5_9GAMM|nr:hypothetical protein BDD26_0873 [Xenorhabdus cabanillasii]
MDLSAVKARTNPSKKVRMSSLNAHPFYCFVRFILDFFHTIQIMIDTAIKAAPAELHALGFLLNL